MQHYFYMIKSHGTVDNFNTELPKRLHIKMAKDAFKHTNKKDYISQMHLWLGWHKLVRKFTAYLSWSVKNYIPRGKKGSKANLSDLDPNQQLDPLKGDIDDDKTESLSTNRISLQHHTAINPPLTMTLDDMKSKLKVHRFDQALERFLRPRSCHRARFLAPFILFILFIFLPFKFNFITLIPFKKNTNDLIRWMSSNGANCY